MESLRFKDYLNDYLDINNISKKDFSMRIGISQKHLIDILSGERDMSLNIIKNISLVMNISPEYIIGIELNYKLENEIRDYLKSQHITEQEFLERFNYKYLIKENYFEFIDKYNKMDIIKDILKFLRVSSPDKIYELSHNVYLKSKNDRPELLLLWLEKCYKETLKQSVEKYDKGNIAHLVSYILKCAKGGVFDEEKLIKEFNKCGIYLVIGYDIPGSKVRGAFKVHKEAPAIYLTLKHKRIADVYFALLHELAHCKTDYNRAKNVSLISYEIENDEIEKRADEQAFNWMVDDVYYDSIKENDSYDVASEKIYPKSFVLYRLAHDKKIDYKDAKYQKYNTLIK